jgi:hypothetical protein
MIARLIFVLFTVGMVAWAAALLVGHGTALVVIIVAASVVAARIAVEL